MFNPTTPLGRRLVVLILLCNAVLSALAAGYQLYGSYQRDTRGVVRTIASVTDSARGGLEQALWEYNFGLIEALIGGIHNREEVSFVRLESTSSADTWERGEVVEASSTSHEVALFHTSAGRAPEQIGLLTVGFDFDVVEQRVWSQFVNLMLSNFVKTLLASVVMLFLFDRLVSRHLSTIATYVSEAQWLSGGSTLALHRSRGGAPDDLDQIVEAINTASMKSLGSYDALVNEVARREEVELELRQTAENLRLTNREQAEFTYALSHDLKSPNNTVVMLLNEIALSANGKLSDDESSLLAMASATSKRMCGLVDGILSYSGMLNDDDVRAAVDLNGVVARVLEDLRADILGAGAQIQSGRLPVVRGDEAQLRLLMQNLIANAIKYRHPDRAPIVSVHAVVDPGDDKATVYVVDNGIGIDEKHRDSIFELFQRLHSQSEIGGLGIGLALCRRVVDNHGGEINFVGNETGGCTFSLTLPVNP